jgi:DNA-binding transcriptional LysR family regulator
MEMHQVRYFLAVARTLNFTRAAEECNVTQPSLTRAIQKLEDEFGGLLFRRERARTHLTDLGREMLPYLERTYEAAQAAKAIAKGIGKAQIAPLHLGVSASIRAPELDAVLAEMAATLPGLDLHLVCAGSPELIEQALDGALDVIIVERPDEAPDRLDAHPLYDLKYLVLFKAEHPLAAKEPLLLSDLHGEVFIERGLDGGARFRSACERAGVEPLFRHQVGDDQQLQRLVAAGLGAGLLPDGYDTIEGLVARALHDGGLAAQVILATISGRRRSPACDAFVRAVRARAWPAGQAASSLRNTTLSSPA